jgi:hypothetical protein
LNSVPDLGVLTRRIYHETFPAFAPLRRFNVLLLAELRTAMGIRLMGR